MHLLNFDREHDLPPRWDGRPVVWEEWKPSTAVFTCPPPAEKCSGCGSTEAPAMAVGTVHPLPGDTFDVDRVKRTRSGREYVSGAHQVPAWRVARLCAFRCPACLLDNVWDTTAVQWWELDSSDYQDEGSYADEA